MEMKKTLIAVLLALVLLIAGMVWIVTQYHIIDLKLYPKNAQQLDLRGKEITVEHYSAIREKLPQTEILWDVPFQGSVYPHDSKTLTVFSLSEQDVADLDHFTWLETLEASTCRDYTQLLALQQRRPELNIRFTLELGGKTFTPDTREVSLNTVATEEIPLLPLLRKLETVTVSAGETMDNLPALQQYCHDQGYAFQVSFGGTAVSDREDTVTIENITTEELFLLELLPELTQLELIAPKTPAENLLALEEVFPKATIRWSQEIGGKLIPHTETLIDISGTEVTDLEAIAQAMTYFPNATQLEMHNCGVDNESMAAFREAHRAEYKVVWTVMLGPKLPTRTDTTSIMPARDGTSNFHDEEAYNMRYCEDVIAVDVGHLDVRNVEWAAFMPHLKYLILAWTGVRDLTPLSGCKELVWLEIDYSPVTDTTPLIGCTALEDINIGKSSVSANGLSQMPWLKNVWAIGNPRAGSQVAMACPDTRVVTSGTHSVGSGWRHLPNYYAMRDALNMFYMDQ